LWGSVNHRRGTEDKQPADLPVAGFGDSTKPGLPVDGGENPRLDGEQ
jgi:hypothetical protein